MADRRPVDRWGDKVIGPGERADVPITISESFASADIQVPVFVWRGLKEGPTVFVTGGVHGDEINGAGAIREIIRHPQFELRAGSLILVPVVNILGFERHSRYLPDRRDLNRSFPGSKQGSLASRMAYTIFQEIVTRSDYGIDLHTAAVRRTNFPNVRADMNDPRVASMARAFGAELIVSGPGPKGSFRLTATQRGCPTIILEAGEVWKVEPIVVEYAVRGIRNCLVHFGMVDGEPDLPDYQLEADATKWVRAMHGGFLHFHVAPGQVLKAGDLIATNTSLTGQEQNTIVAPRDGVILGMTTLPAVSPGDPVCHLAFQRKGALRKLKRAQERADDEDLLSRAREGFARGVLADAESHADETPADPA